MVPEYEARFMELLRYAPHLNTEKLKVNKFVLALTSTFMCESEDTNASDVARCCPEGPHS
jgi:hypothetical protein